MDDKRSKRAPMNTPMGEEIVKLEESMVIEKARPHLDALSRLAPQLNKATDLYMAQLNEIEDRLNNLKLGISVELDDWIKTSAPYERENDDGVVFGIFFTGYTLGYSKTRDWSFVVREYQAKENSDLDPVLQSVIPLLEAPRDLRIAAAEKITDLLKKIEREIKRQVEVLSEVTEKSK